MTKIKPEEAISFEINKETVPNIFERLHLRWYIYKDCRRHTRDASNELYDVMDRDTVTREDFIQNNEAWQNWENTRSYLNDRLQMRKEIIEIDVARFAIEKVIGTNEFRLELMNQLDQDLSQLIPN